MAGVRGILVIGSVCGLFTASVAMQPPGEQPAAPGNVPQRGGNGGRPLTQREPPKRRDVEIPRGPVTREQLKTFIERHAADLDKRREVVGKLHDRLEKAKGDDDLVAIQREFRQMANRDAAAKPQAADRTEMMDVLHQSKPELAVRMTEFAKNYPAANGMIERLGVKSADLVRAKADDPDLFELYTRQIEQAMSVADHVRGMSALVVAGKGETDEGKTKRRELREAVGKHFDTRAAVQARDIDSLKSRLERLQKQLSEQSASREQAIDRWVNELIKKGGELGKPPERKLQPERPNIEKPR